MSIVNNPCDEIDIVEHKIEEDNYITEFQNRFQHELLERIELQEGCTPTLPIYPSLQLTDITITDPHQNKDKSAMVLTNHFTSPQVVGDSNVEKKFLCNICKKTFRNRKRLEIHNRLHTKKNLFYCSYCGKAFNANRDLTRHKMIHTGEKPFSCDICGKSFRQKASLIRHVCNKPDDINSRSSVKYKVINTLDRQYSNSQDISLNSETNYNSDKKHSFQPYLCITCGLNFSQNNHLVLHKMIHTGQKLFSCNICGKSYSDKGNLIVHKREHTGIKPYSCDICGKSYSQRPYLKVHKRKHTGEKPYSCEICNKNFIQNSNLVSHKRIHTSRKSFSCDICGKSFITRGYVAKHKKAKHKNERSETIFVNDTQEVKNLDDLYYDLDFDFVQEKIDLKKENSKEINFNKEYNMINKGEEANVVDKEKENDTSDKKIDKSENYIKNECKDVVKSFCIRKDQENVIIQNEKNLQATVYKSKGCRGGPNTNAIKSKEDDSTDIIDISEEGEPSPHNKTHFSQKHFNNDLDDVIIIDGEDKPVNNQILENLSVEEALAFFSS